MAEPRANRGLSWMRLSGFLWKEILQIRRDPSSLLLGILMPVVLLFIFGYGVSLDPQQVPVALVVDDAGPPARDLAARFTLSPYFAPIHSASMREATALIDAGKVDGIVHIRGNFGADLTRDERAPVQIIVNGVDANRGRLIQGYATGAVSTWLALRQARGEAQGAPPIEVRPRIWFNAAADSRYFLLPGLLTLIMTLIGTLLTALVIAREWERGTMEALLATPLRAEELLLGKLIPYFLLGMAGMVLSVLLAVLEFKVPLRGSVPLLFALGGLFLLASLGLGLVISAATRVQFVAAQISVVAGFLPAFFLSGLLFDLHSTPPPIQVLSHIIPARWFVTISQTLFLAGNIWSLLLPAAAVLMLMAVLLIAVARRKLTRRLPA